jgi:hypothetical protein
MRDLKMRGKTIEGEKDNGNKSYWKTMMKWVKSY